jgi:uncharacterized protein (DUF1697 family)
VATYIGFLRAINLGSTRKFPKASIIKAVEAAGFSDVETYINTGNVRFDTTLRSRAKIEAALEDAFEAEAGFAVPTMVFTQKELREIAEEASSLSHSLGHGGRHSRRRRPPPRSRSSTRASRPTRSHGSAAAPCTCSWATTTTRRG